MNAPTADRTVEGHLQMHRMGAWPVRRLRLSSDAVSIATLTTRSWLSIYFGGGQRVRLADGGSGRIVGTGMNNWIIPVLRSEGGDTVARATPGPHGTYRIDTAGEGLQLIPAATRHRRRGAARWEMKSWDETVAELTGRPETADCHRPVSLAGILLAFTVMALGIPGEHQMGTPTVEW